MHRRTVLLAVAGAGGLTGCVSICDDAGTGRTAAPTDRDDPDETVRNTADGVSAAFRITDGHAPTDDTASATFDGRAVIVTGTMDPAGCNRPTLASVRYSPADSVVTLRVGQESRYGPTATVECGNASFDYRCEFSVASGQPSTVEVVHDYERRADRTFTLERD